MKNLIMACGFALLSVTGITNLQAANGATDYIVLEDWVMLVVPNQYMQASSVQVTVKTNTGYTASQQTTPGAMVTFNLPDGTTVTTVETKYTMGAADSIIIVDIIIQ